MVGPPCPTGQAETQTRILQTLPGERTSYVFVYWSEQLSLHWKLLLLNLNPEWVQFCLRFLWIFCFSQGLVYYVIFCFVLSFLFLEMFILA